MVRVTRWVALFAACLLLAGCGGGRTVTPPPEDNGTAEDVVRPEEPDDTATASSGAASVFCAAVEATDEGAWLTELWQEHRAAVLAGVTTALAGKSSTTAVAAARASLPCLVAERIGDDVPVIVIGAPATGGPAGPPLHNVIAWQWDGVWHAELLQLPHEDPARTVQAATPGPTGIDLVMTAWWQGTGGYGAFELYRAEAALTRLWESDTFTKFRPHVLGPDRLLAGYRTAETEAEPHFFDANCCQPVVGQTLFVRDGDAFAVEAERRHPSAFAAASLFAGAVNIVDPEAAAAVVIDPSVYDVIAFDDGGYEAIALGETPAALWDIEEAEFWHWDVLGNESRPLPEFAPLHWPLDSHALTVVLERHADGWVVTGLE